MKNLTLTRNTTGDSGTFGTLTLDDGTVLQTGELPWRDNLGDLSCIPAGTYLCAQIYSPHFNRMLYHVTGVPHRENIEIHPANWMGDRTKTFQLGGAQVRYKSDLLGCIGLGTTKGVLADQDALIGARPAVDKFHASLNNEPFMLTIYPVPPTVG